MLFRGAVVSARGVVRHQAVTNCAVAIGQPSGARSLHRSARLLGVEEFYEQGEGEWLHDAFGTRADAIDPRRSR